MESTSEQFKAKIERLQNILIDRATGKDVIPRDYVEMRQELIAIPFVLNKLPQFVKTCRNLDQYWEFIKSKFPTYRERRTYIWTQFQPVFNLFDGQTGAPSDESISGILARFDLENVHKIWVTALGRRSDDPEGAITSARTLLETVCKFILDDASVPYKDGAELPALYHLTAKELQLAPSQHSEDIFRQILGGCQAVVEGLGAVRNRLSDAHGKGRKPIKPLARHAELAVNLAGTMATFLVATWNARANEERK